MIEVLRLQQPAGLKVKVTELKLTGTACKIVSKLGNAGTKGQGWGASTIPTPFGVFICYNGDLKEPQPSTRVHEFVHVRQIERAGWFGFLWRYARSYFKRGYNTNTFEEEAYAVEKDISEKGLPDWAKVR